MDPEQRAIYTYPPTNQTTNNTALHQNQKFKTTNTTAWPWT